MLNIILFECGEYPLDLIRNLFKRLVDSSQSKREKKALVGMHIRFTTLDCSLRAGLIMYVGIAHSISVVRPTLRDTTPLIKSKAVMEEYVEWNQLNIPMLLSRI